MFCQHCGAPVEESDKFCTNCGKIPRSAMDSFVNTYSASTGNDAYQATRRNPNGMTDRQEYFRTRASTLAKLRLNGAKKAQIIGVVCYLALALIIGLTVIFVMLVDSARFPSEILVGSFVCSLLIAYLYVWLYNARKKLITEYAVIGVVTTAYLDALFISVNKGGTLGGAFAAIWYIIPAIVVIRALYYFNAEFHAQAPRMDDTVLMRQRNSLTKVIVFWAIAILMIVLAFFVPEIVENSTATTEDTLAMFFCLNLMITVSQSVFSWLAYKITKTLRTGTESGSTQALHAVSCLIVGIGAVVNISNFSAFTGM